MTWGSSSAEISSDNEGSNAAIIPYMTGYFVTSIKYVWQRFFQLLALKETLPGLGLLIERAWHMVYLVRRESRGSK